jgi:hypothetical protein
MEQERKFEILNSLIAAALCSHSLFRTSIIRGRAVRCVLMAYITPGAV